MKVLLIGNYPHDRQESMQRFADMMLRDLQAGGIDAEIIIPKPFFGSLKKSGTGLGKWLGYIDKFLLFPRLLKRRIASLQESGTRDVVVHICDHSNAFYTKALAHIPHLVTCHDLLAVRSALGEITGNPTRWSGRRLQEIILKGLNRAQHVVCDSRATQHDVLRLSILPARQVSVIPIAQNYPYSPMPRDEATRQVQGLLRCSATGPAELPSGHLLHVGGNQWYKNRLGVLRIYAELLSATTIPPKLIMAGKPFTAEMTALVKELGLQDRVVSIESCSNEDLRALYSSARLLLFPSLAEGFGWPVIEAQACGCPVICSNLEPLPEVTRGSASMLDPADEPGFARELQRLLAEPDACADLSARGLENVRRFAPATMIADYTACYRQLLSRIAPASC